MFIDEIKIYARAGHGGKGCVAFHREAYITKGGPSGGNGGRGGSVILQADHDLNNLIQQYYVPRLLAENGEAGMGKGMDGHAGKDLIIKVPCGTLVWQLSDTTPPIQKKMKREDDEEEEVEAEEEPDPRGKSAGMSISTGGRPLIRSSRGNTALEIDLSRGGDDAGHPEEAPGADEPKGVLVADLTENGQQFVLCKGGRGGLGNRNFATARHQTPRFAQPGEPGTEGEFLLELRIMAEVGLVGYPNAGKSTLLTAISKARPKIAPYPFTTLTPQVGILEYPYDYKRLTICDVPGLIEGAHMNVGLGHSFLRHIRRCKILVLLLDMAGTDGRKPWDDYKQLLDELKLYNKELLQKPRIVVANKMDLPVAKKNLAAFKRKRKVPVFNISAGDGTGLPKLLLALRKALP